MSEEWYLAIGEVLGLIVGTLVFFGCWAYCAGTYGFLFGFGMGWLPSSILAFIFRVVAKYLWGPIVVLIVTFLLLVALQIQNAPHA